MFDNNTCAMTIAYHLFMLLDGLPAELGRLEAALQAWTGSMSPSLEGRPHQALGYRTPEQFYQDWLKVNATRKEVLSDTS